MERIEAPLVFTTESAYDRLSLVRNLETVMTSLARRIRDRVKEEIPESQRFEIERIAGLLMKLFNGYDSAPPEFKRGRLAEAIRQVAELKAVVKSIPIKPVDSGRSLMRKDEGNGDDFLSGCVQTLHGVGPRKAELFARKGLFTIEDLLYFLPRRYEDRRTICRITELIPGSRQTVSGKITHCGYARLREKTDFRGFCR